MEFVQDLLKLLFGQLGVVGTVCFVILGYVAYLHHQEREDHKQTREGIKHFIASQNETNMKFLEVMVEMRTVLLRQLNGKV